MEIDKILYNYRLHQYNGQEWSYIDNLSEESLKQVQEQIIHRMNKFDPHEQKIIEQIQTAFALYEKLRNAKRFNSISFNDEQFILNLAFYIDYQQQSSKLALCLSFIENQYYALREVQYSHNINLFRALSEMYERIGEQHFEKLTLLMLDMVVENKEMISEVQHKYYFLESLIQLLNAQTSSEKLTQIVQKISELYKIQNIELFHEKDFRILVEIIIRILSNQQNNQLIQKVLKLYMFIYPKKILSEEKYKFAEISQVLKERFTQLQNDQSIKNLANEILFKIDQTN